MASLQSLCVKFSSTPNRRNLPSSKPLSGKRFRHAKRSHPFHVSCNQKPSPEGRVDRRNMLLGLGGLYGAANYLISESKALADPILAPDFQTCGAAHDANRIEQDPLYVNCCPPVYKGDVLDYELPPARKMRRRRAAHLLSEEEIEDYTEAVRLMRELDKTDPGNPLGFMQQANIHCAYCNGPHHQRSHPGVEIQVHNSWLFFPFHRWYLYFYERILGKLIGKDDFALPFWNWDHPDGMRIPGIFLPERSPLYDKNRNDDNLDRVIDLSISAGAEFSDEKRKRNNLSVMYNEMIRSVSDPLDFSGAAYRAGDQPLPLEGMGSVERGSHTAGHVFMGNPKNKYNEDMGNFYSAARDPIFYCHHTNVDRMWSVWRTLDTDVPKDIEDNDYLDSSFLFYDENKRLVRVKVRDCVDHRKLGYDYDKVKLQWRRQRPSKRAVKADIQKISKGAEAVNNLFPLTLDNITRVSVPKSGKGKVDELLVFKGIKVKASALVKFDVYVNNENDDPTEVDIAEYAGSFAQLPHRDDHRTDRGGEIKLNLKELYDDIDIGDEDETVVVTIVPRENGHYVTINDMQIIKGTPHHHHHHDVHNFDATTPRTQMD